MDTNAIVRRNKNWVGHVMRYIEGCSRGVPKYKKYDIYKQKNELHLHLYFL